ncbi:hypothetical protein [Paraburkholderia tagetis]|uniref:Uncharacterized protein n=1 Tax=Paraburkholderia tagetis TaxID=2913261 RepID=A0A9X1RPR2_9BURK|nr:hypothetical protein [Paraburkholderia tagetis]MCG5073038.1 hypothetical protein [Paraburkholderia tagetis]
MTTGRLPLLLAVLATLTAACLSVLAGWQRGGWLAERALWIAIGVVLVLAAHLLPALLQHRATVLRVCGGALWICCMAATCYGHAVFFTLAQRHAAEARTAIVIHAPPVSPGSAPATARPLTQIAHERAATIAQLAAARARRCASGCATLDARRTALAARLDALDTEAAEARRQEAAQDRAEAERDTARVDPVAAPLAALLGIPATRLDLIAGLAYAALLEGVACFCWLLAFAPARPAQQSRTTLPVAATAAGNEAGIAPPVAPVAAAAARVAEPDEAPIAAPEIRATTNTTADIERITQGVAAGEVRPTVAGIRRFLGCSQTRAVALRRQLNNEARIA